MTATPAETTATERAWKGFKGGLWRDAIDVRDFIQQNYTPYEGDDSFLAGPTAFFESFDRVVAYLHSTPFDRSFRAALVTSRGP